jgi:hypothetical protein
MTTMDGSIYGPSENDYPPGATSVLSGFHEETRQLGLRQFDGGAVSEIHFRRL